jgi:hypothetical protein
MFTLSLALQRHAFDPARLNALLRAGYGFLRLSSAADRRPMVLKHFSQITTIMVQAQAEELQGTAFYLYRGALDRCASACGFALRMGMLVQLSAEQRRFV